MSLAQEGGFDLGSNPFWGGELNGHTLVLVQHQKPLGRVIVDFGEVKEITSVALCFEKMLPSHTFQKLNIPVNPLT